MGNLQDFNHALTHWSFGVAILVGLVASEYSGAEAVVAIMVAGISSTLSVLCCSQRAGSEDQYRRKKLSDVLHFLILWHDILTNLVAAATCARLASATVDYISKEHFREFLFGLEQHSLGEPWPDVLGVTIIVVVTVLFMMGLEKSSTISSLLFVAILCNFAFFAAIGSFHTIIKFGKWCDNFQVHSYRKVLAAAAMCFFAFVHNVPKTQKNNCLKMFTIIFNPLVFYTVTAIIFSMMTHYRELVGKAIPLIQVFENRDVDWARPIIAVFTICIVCLVLTDVLPNVYNSFVKLASKEWRVFVSSIMYRSPVSGAPILGIFAAGSLAAILAFACPLSHLIKLLNASALVKCILISYQLVYERYKPEVNYDCLVYNTNVHYKKLSRNPTRPIVPIKQSKHMSITEKIKDFFVAKPQYVHRLNSPKISRKSNDSVNDKIEERECLLLDDYSNKSVNIDLIEDSASENEDDLVLCSDGEGSGNSTDIDLIVEEYKEGLRVATIGKFTKMRPSTKLTSIVVILCLVTTLVASVCLSLYALQIVHLTWPSIMGLIVATVITMAMPQNISEKSKETILPSILFPVCQVTSIAVNTILTSTLLIDIWQGIVFWSLAGLFLFWRCECCSCEGLTKINIQINPDVQYAHREVIADTVCITR